MITNLLLATLHKETKHTGIWKVLCFLLLNLGLGISVKAQSTITIPVPYEDTAPELNGGSTANTRQPLTNFQKFERSAAIYTAAEIGQTGTITAIAYDLKSVSNPQPSQVQVYLKAVSLSTTSFAGATIAGELSGATLVYDEVLSYPASVPAGQSNWILLDFDVVDFPYNHTTNNLEVIVVTTNPCASCQFGADFTSTAKLSRFNDNLSNAFLFETDSPTASPPQFSRAITNFRPNIQITITPTSIPICQAPTAVSVTGGVNSITVSFTPSAGLTGNYFINYNGTPVQLNNTGASQTITGVTAGNYTYDVYKNCNGTLVSGGTGPVTVTDPAAVCEAPTNVSVTSPSANTITVSYTASSGLAGNYFLEYGANTVQLTSNPQTITSVPAGTYNFIVYKLCSATRVNGTPTGSVTVNDPAPVCEAPTGVSVTSPSANTITVSYTASSGLAGNYFLEYGSNTVQLTSNPQTITSVPAGSYSFVVYKLCGATRINGTPTGTVVVNDPTPTPVCEAPTNVSVTSPSANTITASYTASSGLAGNYFLEYGSNTIQLTSNPQTITSVPAGSYSFVVYKLCGATRVNGTPTGTVGVNDPSPVCEAPTGVSVTSPSANALTVSYTASSGLAGNYFLEYGSNTIQLTSNPQTITSVPAGTYSFVVYKLCGATRVNGTPTGSVTVSDPAPNCNPVIVNSTTPALNSVVFNYTTGSAGTHSITMTDAAGVAPTVNTTLGTSPATVAGLQSGVTYNYSIVTACTSGGNSAAATGQVTTTSPTPTCTTPTDLAVTKTSTTAQLTFTDNSGSEPGTFLVKFGAPGFNFASAGTVVSGPPYNVGSLTPGTTYEFAVQKTCNNGAPSLIEREQFTTDAACNPPIAGTAISNSFNELTVSYTASATGAAGNYFLAYTPVGGGATTTVPLTTNPQTITSIPAGDYNFTIYKDCSGIQSTSNPGGTVTVLDAPLPPVCVDGIWVGTTSSDWHTASNWCNGVIPDGSTNVIIPGNTGANPVPNYPVISVTALANNLTIQTNATLTLASGVLTINGLYANLGTLIDNGDGSLVFNSVLPQTLGKPGNILTFLDLTTGPGGIIQGGPIRVRRVLTLNGNLTTLGNELTLLADNAVQSMVVNNGSAMIIGAATMEKYINPGINPSFGYRHLTSPIADATLNQLNDDTPLITNPAYNNDPATANPFPNIFRYEESRVTPANPTFDAGWVSPNNVNEQMMPGVGYTVNMLPVEINFTGTLNNGTITRTLTRTNPGVVKSGWNLIGNPYPSPLDWNQVNLPTDVEGAAYIFRSNGVTAYTGSYIAYVNGVPANGQFIPAMQGFFVRANAPSTSITFENNDRVTTYENPALYKQAETRPLIELTLKDNTGKEDKTYVYFENGATATFDSRFDAFKMPNSGPIPTLYSEAGPEQLAINGLPLSTATTIIPLGGKVPQAGTWSIQADQIMNFLPNQTIYLEDMVTNTMHNLSQQNIYTFSTTQTNLNGRFYLRFGPGAVTGISKADLAAKVQVYPNPNKGEFTLSMPSFNSPAVEATLFNAVGQKVWTKTLQTNGAYLKEKITTHKLPHGVYTLRLETNAGPVQRKIIIE